MRNPEVDACRAREEAFTLVETLVAMTIMAVAVTGILGSFSGALMAGSVAEDYAKASIRMQQVMAQIRAGAITPYDVTEGTFEGDNKYQWAVSFTETDTDYLYEVEVKVTWTRARRPREMKLTTYQYCDPLAASVVM